MRKLDRAEAMAIRIGLQMQAAQVMRLWKASTDPHGIAGHKARYERIENLISLMKPGTTITVGV